MIDVAPRYWPSLRFLAKVPILREVGLWNCVILFRTPNAPARSLPALAGAR